jgi:hypothetical protein
MTAQVSDATSARRLSLSQKLAVASGAAAAIAGVAAPQSAEAGIVQSNTLPMSPPASSGSNYWDVDGDGRDDFRVQNAGSIARLRELTSARFVAPATVLGDGFAKLNAGFNVGGSMTAGYKFLSGGQVISITNGGNIDSQVGAQGWAIGNTGYFGFKFSTMSGVHYGWGQISITGTPAGQG